MRDTSGPRGYLAQVFHWSGGTGVDGRRALLSLLACALPIAACLAWGRPALGYVIALGAVLMSGEAQAGQAEPPTSVRAALWPVAVAIAVASALVRLPATDAWMIALVTGAATLVNYSRPAAVAGVRFIVLLVLNLGLLGAHGAHRGAALLFGLGALWRMALRLLARREQGVAAAVPAGGNAGAAGKAVTTPTARQRRIHLRRMLATLPGWQYPLRLAFGLLAACALRAWQPLHHYDWIVLSVVLMTPRALEHLPVAITQRALGTFVGVALAGAVLHLGTPPIVVAVLVGVLGAAAPLAREGNYAAYCALATPLILLAMSANAPVGDGMLADRLVATVAGAAIVTIANLVMEALLRRRPA